MSTVDIRPDHADIVHKILQKFVPERSVWVFGSRAKWLAKEYSDLDLCIIGDTPLSFVTLGLLDEAFEDSDLPYKVDCIDWATTSPEFRKIIARDKVVFQKGQNKEMQNHLKQGWVETTLGAVAEINPSEKLSRNSIAPKISMSELNSFYKIPSHFTLEKYNGGTKFRNGDTLIARITPCLENGKTAYINILPSDNIVGFGSTEFIVLREKEKLSDKQFLYYFSISENFRKIAISSMTGTSGRQRVQTEVIVNHIFKFPPLSQQKKIASILKSLDDKIAINNQINKTLETMAQALFKSWFVDFDPVYAKKQVLESGGTEIDANIAAMSVISGKSDAELEELKTGNPQAYSELEHTASLFPSDFEDSELGQIPKGWGVKEFSDLCRKIESGGTPKRNKSEYWNGDILWLSSGEVRDKIIIQTKEKITNEGLKNSSAKLWSKFSTVVAMYGATAGQVCLIANDMTANQACCGLIPKNNCISYLFISAQNSVEELSGKASGSAQQNLNKGLVSSHKLLIPDDFILGEFEKRILTNILLMIENIKQSQTLSKIRDSLLPKLLSGEIDVNNKGY